MLRPGGFVSDLTIRGPRPIVAPETVAPKPAAGITVPPEVLQTGLAPVRKTSPLALSEARVLLDGLKGLAEKAATKDPPPALAALRQIIKQLDSMSSKELSFPLAAVLGFLSPLACAVDKTSQAEGRAGVEAQTVVSNLEAALSKLPLGKLDLKGPAGAALRAASTPQTQELLAEVLSHHPHPVSALETLGRAPELAAMLQKAAKMYPPQADRAALVQSLTQDLEVGGVGQDLRAMLGELRLSKQDIDTFFEAFAQVRGGFERGAGLGDDMQRVNWMHTRIELLHTAEAAKNLGMDGSTPDGRLGVLAALYGSLVSDSFKDKGTFSLLWHNRPGAELVAPLVLGRVMDLAQPDNQKLLAWTMRVAHEHQVTPPMFMAGPMKGLLSQVAAQLPADQKPAADAAIAEVFATVSKPMQAPQKDGEIIFSEAARGLMEKAGLSGWAVPHDSPWRTASMAAIVGDVWQYASPEGVIKIAVDLRDPGSPAGPFMRDPVISAGWLKQARPDAAQAIKDAGQGGAVESSLGFSFGQGMSVVDDAKLVDFMAGKQKLMQQMLEQQVLPKVEQRLREHLGVKAGQPTPNIPYWNTPVGTDGVLSAQDRASADLVKKTFQDVMAQVGGVPLDPFGAQK